MTRVHGDSARRPALPWAVALALWIAFIWGHSLVQGPQSSAESGAVVGLLRPLFEAVGVADTDVMSLVVRKCAHFSEYAVLGAISRGLLVARRAESGRPALPAGLLVALVPAIDESIQLFVPGRSGSPVDVCIDLAGVVAGSALSWALSRQLARSRAR